MTEWMRARFWDFAKTMAPADRHPSPEESFQAGFDLAIKIFESHKGQPDHDAEILGYEDGEAPTESSKMWKLVNGKTP